MTPTTTSPNHTRRWWLPSTGVILWLVFFLGLSLSQWRVALISRDGDPCLHWHLGNWMLTQHQIIRTDSLSYTKPDAPVTSKEWLAEVAFATAGNLLGWNGIVLFSAALIATAYFLLYRQLLAEGNEMLVAAAMVVLAAYGCRLHWLARPHLITHLLIVVFGWQLRAFVRGRVSAAGLLGRLVPLMGLWANVHGAFPIGLVLIGSYCCGLGLERRWRAASTLALAGMAGLVVTFLNPNGWRLHAIILHYLSDPTFVGGVNEFLAPNFHSEMANGFLLQLFVLAGLLLVARQKWSPTDLVVLGVWAYFALHSLRNLPVFGLVAAPIFAEHLHGFLAEPAAYWKQRVREISHNLGAQSAAADGRIYIAAAVIALLAVSIKPSGGQPLLVTNLATNEFPVAAVQYLKAHPAVIGERMFNPDTWGGYLMLVLPERRVFMDSRHEFYGGKFIHEYKQTVSVSSNWPAALDKYRVDWTLLPADQPLNQILAIHPDWQPVYTDAVTAVYRKLR